MPLKTLLRRIQLLTVPERIFELYVWAKFEHFGDCSFHKVEHEDFVCRDYAFFLFIRLSIIK